MSKISIERIELDKPIIRNEYEIETIKQVVSDVLGMNEDDVIIYYSDVKEPEL